MFSFSANKIKQHTTSQNEFYSSGSCVLIIIMGSIHWVSWPEWQQLDLREPNLWGYSSLKIIQRLIGLPADFITQSFTASVSCRNVLSHIAIILQMIFFSLRCHLPPLSFRVRWQSFKARLLKPSDDSVYLEVASPYSSRWRGLEIT